MSEPRMMVLTAQARYPDVVFAPLGGAMVHAIDYRLEVPSRWCFALCGRSGFADETMDALDGVCLHCAAKLAASASPLPKENG